VLDSDYLGANVSLVGFDGTVLSSSFFSTATKFGSNIPHNDSYPALTGDSVLPTMPQVGRWITTVDRGQGILTWIDVETGSPLQRLAMGPDKALNMQDYVEISPHKAYVPVLDPTLIPGAPSVEAGNNIVIVDPTANAATGAIDLTPAMVGESSQFYAHPGRALVVGNRLYVLLSGFDLYYTASTLSRLVTIDTGTDAIVAVDKIPDLHDCTGIALSPDQTKIAVTCSGTWKIDSTLQNPTSDPATSGLVLFSRSDMGVTEIKSWAAAGLGGGTLGFTVSFIDEDHVAFTTIGQSAESGQPARDDTFVTLDLSTGTPEVLLRDATPASIGDVRCFPACGVCFVPEAVEPMYSGATLHRYAAANGVLGARMDIVVDADVELPPRFLGAF
jgi:hypothetical protein